MSSELSSNNKFMISFALMFFLVAPPVKADPVIAGEVLPPASATLVTDPDLIRSIGVGREDDPVWCYSNDANAILITGPERERERCQLKLLQKVDQLTAIHKLELGTLAVQLESLSKKHDDLMKIKNKEIEDLTAAALKRPNEYSLWWATGGAAVGVLTTLTIIFMVK